MKHIITISSLLLSQLTAANFVMSEATADQTSVIGMTENQKLGMEAIRKHRIAMQNNDPTYDIQCIKNGARPECLTLENCLKKPDIMLQFDQISDTVRVMLAIPTASKPVKTYCSAVLAAIAEIIPIIEARDAEIKRIADEQASQELERLAVLVQNGGLLGPAGATDAAAAGDAAVRRSVNDGALSAQEAVLARPKDDATRSADAECVVGQDSVDTAVAQVVAVSTPEPTPLERTTAVGVEKLGKMCPALFKPSDGIGFVAWLLTQEYATVRSPALVKLAALLVGSLAEASYAEFSGAESTKVLSLIEAFKAVFRDKKGVSYKGSQEAKFLTEVSVDGVSTYTLIVKANGDDAPAETITIKVDRTVPDDVVVTASAPEIEHLSAAMFTAE